MNIAVTKVETAAPTSFEYRTPGTGKQEFRGQGQFPFEFFERFFDGDPRASAAAPQRRAGLRLPDRRERLHRHEQSRRGRRRQDHRHAAGRPQVRRDARRQRPADGPRADQDRRDAACRTSRSAIPTRRASATGSSRSAIRSVSAARRRPASSRRAAATSASIGTTYNDYLQLDAPINFGNSGGPVFNVAGEVVGVNTAIFSPNGGNVGIGFAIPANQAKNIVADLRENGSVERGWLGVQIQDLDEDLARSLRIERNRRRTRGRGRRRRSRCARRRAGRRRDHAFQRSARSTRPAR